MGMITGLKLLSEKKNETLPVSPYSFCSYGGNGYFYDVWRIKKPGHKDPVEGDSDAMHRTMNRCPRRGWTSLLSGDSPLTSRNQWWIVLISVKLGAADMEV